MYVPVNTAQTTITRNSRPPLQAFAMDVIPACRHTPDDLLIGGHLHETDWAVALDGLASAVVLFCGYSRRDVNSEAVGSIFEHGTELLYIRISVCWGGE